MPESPPTLVVPTRVVDVQRPGSALVDSDGNIKYAPDGSTHCTPVALGTMTVSIVVFPDDPKHTRLYDRDRGAEPNSAYLDSLTSVDGHVMSDGRINPDAPDGTITYLRKLDADEPASTQ